MGCTCQLAQTINPDSTYGATLFDMAEDFQVDPYVLTSRPVTLAGEERAAGADSSSNTGRPTSATGLSVNRISKWEESGKDHSTWPGFDTKARELAHEYPALGIGRGYESGTQYDDTDYAGQLWEMLRGEYLPPMPKA